MKTMTTHTLRATLMALFCLVALSAMADATVNVTTTEGGQLQAKVEETGNAASDVTSLTVTGPLNGTDIDYLRNSLTSIQNLDLTDASIVSGGKYIANYTTYYTSDNRISEKMFYELTNLTTICLPSTLSGIEERAFSDCTNLISITMPNNFSGTIGEFAFSSCEKLESIQIPEGTESIGTMCFQYCSALEEVYFPSTLSSIGTEAFKYCTSLKSVTLPNSLTRLGGYAFYRCIYEA